MADCPLYKIITDKDIGKYGFNLRHVLPRTQTGDLGDHGYCQYDLKICGCFGSGGFAGDCRLGLTEEQQKQVYELLKQAYEIVSKAKTVKVPVHQ
jgi:hypothetical protein